MRKAIRKIICWRFREKLDSSSKTNHKSSKNMIIWNRWFFFAIGKYSNSKATDEFSIGSIALSHFLKRFRKLDQKKCLNDETSRLLLFVGLMILLFYPFFVWGEKTISAAGGDFPIQSIIFLHKAPMDYKMIWTTINLYRSLILARSLIMILFIHALCVCTKVQNYLSKIGLAAIICHEKLCKIL